MPDDVKGQVPPPYPLAMVVCDAIWREPRTGKLFLLGCLSTLEVEAFPTTHPTLALYVALTNGRGIASYRVELVGGEDELEPIWEFEGNVTLENPRHIAEFEITLRDVVFPEPGQYSFQFFVNNQFLLERRIQAFESKEEDYE